MKENLPIKIQIIKDRVILGEPPKEKVFRSDLQKSKTKK